MTNQETIRAVIDRVLWTAGATEGNRRLLAEAISESLAAPAVANAAKTDELPPAEHDKDMDRHYLPLPNGWEIQTKGKGSTFRICKVNGEDNYERWQVTDERLHNPLQRMAEDCRAAIAATAPNTAVADEGRRDEAHKLARILFGMVEGDGRVDGVNIYADGYSAPDGDVFVLRAAELLIEQAAEAKELTRYVEHFALASRKSDSTQPDEAKRGPIWDAIQRACGELPEGYEIRLHMENGYGGIEWESPSGIVTLIDGEGFISSDIEEALAATLSAHAGQGAKA